MNSVMKAAASTLKNNRIRPPYMYYELIFGKRLTLQLIYNNYLGSLQCCALGAEITPAPPPSIYNNFRFFF